MNTRYPQVDADDPAAQALLRQTLEAARAGRLRKSPTALSPELARQLAEFRDRTPFSAEVIWAGPSRALVIAEPEDGGELLLVAFDAMTFADEGPRQ